MLWDIMQQVQISQAQSDADSARNDAKYGRQRLDRVDDHLARSALQCQAMWEILRDRLGVTDQELLNKMNEIDLRDGVLDGKMTSPAQDCAACHRKSKTKTGRCLYCGEPMPSQNVFG